MKARQTFSQDLQTVFKMIGWGERLFSAHEYMITTSLVRGDIVNSINPLVDEQKNLNTSLPMSEVNLRGVRTANTPQILAEPRRFASLIGRLVSDIQ